MTRLFVVLSRRIRVCRDKHVFFTKIRLLSRQAYFCQDKRRVLSRQAYFCQDKRRVLSRQKSACRNKGFVATKLPLSRQKYFVETKIILSRQMFVATSIPLSRQYYKQKLYLWQLPPMTVYCPGRRLYIILGRSVELEETSK